ncbi:MAG: AAA family ATPase, partial [Microbacterium arborescens]
PLSDEALTAAATATEGVTGSFAKELIRRAVLAAAIEQRQVCDEHLAHVLDEIMQSRQHLTRRMLGATMSETAPDVDLPPHGGCVAQLSFLGSE